MDFWKVVLKKKKSVGFSKQDDIHYLDMVEEEKEEDEETRRIRDRRFEFMTDRLMLTKKEKENVKKKNLWGDHEMKIDDSYFFEIVRTMNQSTDLRSGRFRAEYSKRSSYIDVIFAIFIQISYKKINYNNIHSYFKEGISKCVIKLRDSYDNFMSEMKTNNKISNDIVTLLKSKSSYGDMKYSIFIEYNIVFWINQIIEELKYITVVLHPRTSENRGEKTYYIYNADSIFVRNISKKVKQNPFNVQKNDVDDIINLLKTYYNEVDIRLSNRIKKEIQSINTKLKDLINRCEHIFHINKHMDNVRKKFTEEMKKKSYDENKKMIDNSDLLDLFVDTMYYKNILSDLVSISEDTVVRFKKDLEKKEEEEKEVKKKPEEKLTDEEKKIIKLLNFKITITKEDMEALMSFNEDAYDVIDEYDRSNLVSLINEYGSSSYSINSIKGRIEKICKYIPLIIHDNKPHIKLTSREAPYDYGVEDLVSEFKINMDEIFFNVIKSIFTPTFSTYTGVTNPIIFLSSLKNISGLKTFDNIISTYNTYIKDNISIMESCREEKILFWIAHLIGTGNIEPATGFLLSVSLQDDIYNQLRPIDKLHFQLPI
jgi:hypothetical protein